MRAANGLPVAAGSGGVGADGAGKMAEAEISAGGDGNIVTRSRWQRIADEEADKGKGEATQETASASVQGALHKNLGLRGDGYTVVGIHLRGRPPAIEQGGDAMPADWRQNVANTCWTCAEKLLAHIEGPKVSCRM